MTTEQILCIDTRKQENREKIRKFLYLIPQYKKYKKTEEEVPLEQLEKMLYTVVSRYAVTIQWMSYVNDLDSGSRYWSISFRNDKDMTHLGSIAEPNLYYVVAKTAIKLYALVKKNDGSLITKEEYLLRKNTNGVAEE